MTTCRTRRPRAVRSAVATVCTAAATVSLCAACGGGGSKPAPPAPSSSSSVPVRPKAAKPVKPAKPAAKAVNPLTGTGSAATGPVIAVKIDDTLPGRPQRNIDEADIVYIEEAEGGLTRLAAVFAGHKPVVGYVRSTRPSDPELLLQYGRITLAASGGGHDALPILDHSGLRSWIQDRRAPYYHRVFRNESDYINVTLDLAKVAARVKSPPAHSIGFTWSASYPALAKARRGTTIRTLVGRQLVNFRFDARTKRYVRYIDGVRQVAADGHPVATPNVIVQACRVTAHPKDTDVNGNPSQFTHSIGKGAVTVFRNGKRIDGTWIRSSKSGGTRLLDRAGHPIPLAPGGAWVVLVRTGAGVSS